LIAPGEQSEISGRRYCKLPVSLRSQKLTHEQYIATWMLVNESLLSVNAGIMIFSVNRLATMWTNRFQVLRAGTQLIVRYIRINRYSMSMNGAVHVDRC
jgi:hypothetical protein